MAAVVRTLTPLLALAGGVVANPRLLAFPRGSNGTCPSDIPVSCHNETVVENTCCFIPAGQLLQTQFWDSKPATGPSDSWTIHGLWPDNCDGTYPAECDKDRAYTDIEGLLSAGGGQETLDYMKKYWKDYKGQDETFWQHEWGKHGTCISTLEPKCFQGYKDKMEAVEYFGKTVELFKSLPTYKWLADAGITPDAHKSYDLSEIASVLKKQHGNEVTLNCKGKNLNEVWYHFNVQGSLQAGKFISAAPDGAKGKCPDKVYYDPKEGGDNGGGGDGGGDGGDN